MIAHWPLLLLLLVLAESCHRLDAWLERSHYGPTRARRAQRLAELDAEHAERLRAARVTAGVNARFPNMTWEQAEAVAGRAEALVRERPELSWDLALLTELAR